MALSPANVSTAPTRWQRLQSAVREFRALSLHRRHLLLTLVNNAQELEKCSRQAPADILYQKVLEQLKNAEKHNPVTPDRQRLDFEGVSGALSEMVRRDALSLLKQFRPRFSEGEHRLLKKKLNSAGAGLSEPLDTLNPGVKGLSAGPIRRIRDELVEKIKRWPGRSVHVEKSVKRPLGGLEEGIGLYNTHFNTTALMKFLDSRDSEWTSDLRYCLKQLQKIEVLLN